MEGVHITRSRRKSIELSIDDHLQIAVKAPLWVTDRAIDHFIAQKADWISRKKPPRPPAYRHIRPYRKRKWKRCAAGPRRSCRLG